MRVLLCAIGGGHRWATVTDGAGDLTSCRRCGTIRHTRIASVKDASFAVHVNVAADFDRPQQHGPDELDAV